MKRIEIKVVANGYMAVNTPGSHDPLGQVARETVPYVFETFGSLSTWLLNQLDPIDTNDLGQWPKQSLAERP